MIITAEEKLMYGVMKAIFDSGIPVSFKGSMVLKACLVDAGYVEETRHTVDIDANWYSDSAPTAEDMVESLQNAITKGGIDLKVILYRMYGEGRSAGFELRDNSTDEVIFTMDIDVNRPAISTRIYEIEGIRFRGASSTQMIADKVSSISTEKVFRRIKDVVDLYYMSGVFEFDCNEVLQTLKDNGRTLGDFSRFTNGKEDLSHAYQKFRFSGDVNKPDFDEVYSAVYQFIVGIIPK